MSDQTAAANLEITSALAEAAEEILRDFAENAELEVALVVDHSGALIAGISADDDVNVDTVGALVAGTVGAIRALGKSVGETKALESMHHGEVTTIYLRELSERFLLVGTAESGLPAGIIREVGSRIATPLLSVLCGEEIVEKTDNEVIDFKDEPVEEVDELIKLTDTSEPDLPAVEADETADSEDDTPEAKSTSAPPLVVDSPFEFVDDDDDFDPDGAEEEEEGIAADGQIFEIGVDDDAPPNETTSEVGDVEVSDEKAESEEDADSEKEDEQLEGENGDGVFQLGDEEDDDDESGVAAPLLVSPMMPKPEQIKIEIDEDEESNSVAAITTPIATDIIKKKVISDPPSEDSATAKPEVPASKEPAEDHQDTEPDDDEPIGGPRYVFEIG